MRGTQVPVFPAADCRSLRADDVGLQAEQYHDQCDKPIAGDAGHYTIRCMSREKSNDPRARLEHQLRILADGVQDHPTVPASYLDAVLDDNVAVLLPPTHCAFRDCTWSLSWEDTHGERKLFEYKKERERERERERLLLPLMF